MEAVHAECERMAKVYYEWRTNQDWSGGCCSASRMRMLQGRLCGRFWLVSVSRTYGDLRISSNGAWDRAAQGLATGSLAADMLAELERLKQVLRDRTESYMAADRKWRLKHGKELLEQQELRERDDE